MAFSNSSMPKYASSGPIISSSLSQQNSIRCRCFVKCCESEQSAKEVVRLAANVPKLGIGSPIVITEAPQMIKTAASVPCLRVNAGLVKPGDVGRIVSRKPKDVWAVRLSIGTYLIDGKYFKALEIDE